jgi:hypothetical protein
VYIGGKPSLLKISLIHPENIEGAIKNGQTKETRNIG